MKTSNILKGILFIFIISVIVAEKIQLKTASEKIDFSDPFGAYYNEQSFDFKHVVVKNNNRGLVKFFQKNEGLVKYGDDIIDKFSASVKNDTLYIDFDESLTLQSPTFLQGENLIVFYDMLYSVKAIDAKIYINAGDIEVLRVTTEKASDFCMHVASCKKLIYDTKGTTKARFRFGPLSKIDTLKIKASENSYVDLENVLTKHIEITEYDKAKVDTLKLQKINNYL